MAASANAIFLSYSAQDEEAARRICSALRAAGLDVWFDQSELRGGDAWDASIRRQIKDCALFVPLNARPPKPSKTRTTYTDPGWASSTRWTVVAVGELPVTPAVVRSKCSPPQMNSAR